MEKFSDSMNLDVICSNCGERNGKHSLRGDRCPNDSGTIFDAMNERVQAFVNRAFPIAPLFDPEAFCNAIEGQEGPVTWGR
jgi:hypothetical protein